MVETIKRKKALSVSPLKSSQPVGATLAFLGINRAMPMMHGSQGCTAFAKVFFVRHFREPIPLQTTAMDQVSTVMGADENVHEGLKTVSEKSSPSLIGLFTTGLSEMQGADIVRGVKEFREMYPQFEHVKVVPVNTPDFKGCMETGYAEAVRSMIDVLVPTAEDAGTCPGRRQRQINILAGSCMTPGDVESLKELVELFGLRPVVIPDLSDSLDGHLTDEEFTPVTIGGTPVSEFDTLGDAKATLVFGASMDAAASLLQQRTGVPSYSFHKLFGLDATDEIISVLQSLSDIEVPERIERQRSQLQDAMLDTHFMLGQARVAVALDADSLSSFAQLLQENGAEVVAAVTPSKAPALETLSLETVKLGDLEDLEHLAKEQNAELMISNSHGLESAHRLGIPLLRAGFPQYDLLGGYQRTWIGYRGARQALYDLANIIVSLEKGEIHPYRSVYAQKLPEEAQAHGYAAQATHHVQ